MSKINFPHILAINGWTKETIDFRLLLGRLWVTDEYYGKYGTVEELLCHPSQALQFAVDVKNLTDLKHLNVEDILRFLVNTRKGKFFLDMEANYGKTKDSTVSM